MAPMEIGDAGVPVVTDDAVQRMAARDWSPWGNRVRAGGAGRLIGGTDRRGPAGHAAGHDLRDRGHGHRHAPARHGMAERVPPRGPGLRAGTGRHRHHADPAPPLGPGHHAGLSAGKPAGSARAEVGPAAMYFATMWTYLSGFAAVVYFAAPIIYLLFGILPVTSLSADFFLRFIPFMVVNQLLFAVAGKASPPGAGSSTASLCSHLDQSLHDGGPERLAGRPLGFAVTPKDRQSGGPRWSLIRPQIAVSVLLFIAVVVGIARLVAGMSEPIGTLVNVSWVVFDLVVMSVLVRAVLYRGYSAGSSDDHPDRSTESSKERTIRGPEL